MSDSLDVQYLEAILKASHIPFIREYKFDKSRRWRFDFAFPEHFVAVEVEGGVWIGGRHTRASGFVKDLEKYNQAASMGWLVLRFSPDMIESGTALEMIEKTLRRRIGLE